MKSIEISLGQAVSHSPKLVQDPNQRSISSTIPIARDQRSGWPCGRRLKWLYFAAVKSCAAPLGQAATHAPQPMQAAASIAASAASLGINISLASRAAPVGAEM